MYRRVIIAALLSLLPPAGQARFSRDDLWCAHGSDSTAFLRGADISFIPQIEDLGGVYKEQGAPDDPLHIFRDHGFNCIRLKLWHRPVDDYNNLEKILSMAVRAKESGFACLLDFHYSDTWADPGHQTKPAAWQGLTFEVLKDSVYQYTRNVLRALYDQQTLPAMVQIGNEINSGMLWDDGRVGGAFDTPQQWTKLGTLLKEGIRGVRESCPDGSSVLVMIHFANAANNGSCRWFFDHLCAEGVDCDIIGLSYYPWWHGTLDQVEDNLNDAAIRYGKDIIIVETAYPWTLDWFDSQNNVVGYQNQLHPGYPATVEGQTAFLRRLMNVIYTTNDQRGRGVFYWAPEYISVQPLGSPWENLALFDFQGNVLPSMDVFLEDLGTPSPIRVVLRLNTATHLDTLRQHHFVQIRGEVSGVSFNYLPDGRKVSWSADSELILANVGGDYWESSFQMFPGDILFSKFWTGYSSGKGTFQRFGWEGPTDPFGDFGGNRRAIVAGKRDTVITLQYYNSTDNFKDQYWQPFESRKDSIALYFRVNMAKAMVSGRFDPDSHGPVAVRGDTVASGGMLAWDTSKMSLVREAGSIAEDSFWSGACYLPQSALHPGDTLEYKYYIENAPHGWESNIANRRFIFTESLVQNKKDTTIHWVYFDEPDSATQVKPHGREVPGSFELHRNYPNPFNQGTRISYSIAHPMYLRIGVYDVNGKHIAALVQGDHHAGDYSLLWPARHDDGSALPSGLYFICLTTQFGVKTRKILLIK